MMAANVVRHLGVALLAGGLVAGCSVFEAKPIDYKSAGKLPTLEVPPDLIRPGRDDRYQVPDGPTASGGSSTTLSTVEADRLRRPQLAPGTTNVLPDAGEIRIARAGNERWLVVPEAPEKLWPLVKEFWQDNGFIVRVEQPEAGVMETDWAENRAKIPNDGIRSILGRVLDTAYSTGERDKFRTRLERGADAKTTEVYVSHRGMVESIVNSARGQEGTLWQPRQPNADLEAEFLRRLMVRLGLDDTRAKAQLAVGRAPERAQLTGGDSPAGRLDIAEPFDRAWRRVGLALDRVGFTVEDRDRAKGFYYVRYVDPRTDEPAKKSGGFLSRLAFWRSDDAKVANPNEQFQVRVTGGAADATQVTVLAKDGTPDATGTAKRILGLLHEQLK